MLKNQRDALWPQALDLEKLERGGRKFLEQRIAALARAAFHDIRDDSREAFPDARNVRNLAVRIAQNIVNALGITFDSRRAVAIAADAEGILPGDLHQVSRLPQHARNFAILHLALESIVRSGAGRTMAWGGKVLTPYGA